MKDPLLSKIEYIALEITKEIIKRENVYDPTSSASTGARAAFSMLEELDLWKEEVKKCQK